MGSILSSNPYNTASSSSESFSLANNHLSRYSSIPTSDPDLLATQTNTVSSSSSLPSASSSNPQTANTPTQTATSHSSSANMSSRHSMSSQSDRFHYQEDAVEEETIDLDSLELGEPIPGEERASRFECGRCTSHCWFFLVCLSFIFISSLPRILTLVDFIITALIYSTSFRDKTSPSLTFWQFLKEDFDDYSFERSGASLIILAFCRFVILFYTFAYRFNLQKWSFYLSTFVMLFSVSFVFIKFIFNKNSSMLGLLIWSLLISIVEYVVYMLSRRKRIRRVNFSHALVTHIGITGRSGWSDKSLEEEAHKRKLEASQQNRHRLTNKALSTSNLTANRIDTPLSSSPPTTTLSQKQTNSHNDVTARLIAHDSLAHTNLKAQQQHTHSNNHQHDHIQSSTSSASTASSSSVSSSSSSNSSSSTSSASSLSTYHAISPRMSPSSSFKNISSAVPRDDNHILSSLEDADSLYYRMDSELTVHYKVCVQGKHITKHDSAFFQQLHQSYSKNNNKPLDVSSNKTIRHTSQLMHLSASNNQNQLNDNETLTASSSTSYSTSSSYANSNLSNSTASHSTPPQQGWAKLNIPHQKDSLSIHSDSSLPSDDLKDRLESEDQTDPHLAHDSHSRQVKRSPHAVILLHGFGGSTFSWRAIWNELCDTCSLVLAFDRPGFGLTSRPLPSSSTSSPHQKQESIYSQGWSVKILLKLMDYLQISRAVLIGHSTGGAIAIRAAQLYPHRVQGLILVSPHIYSEGFPSMLKTLFQTKLGKEMVTQLSRSEMGEVTMKRAWYKSEHIPVETLEYYQALTKVKGWHEALIEMASATDNEPVSRRLDLLIELPILFLHGQQDKLVSIQETIKAYKAIATAALQAHNNQHGASDQIHQDHVDHLSSISIAHTHNNQTTSVSSSHSHHSHSQHVHAHRLELVKLDPCSHVPHEEFPHMFMLQVKKFLSKLDSEMLGAN